MVRNGLKKRVEDKEDLDNYNMMVLFQLEKNHKNDMSNTYNGKKTC